MVDQIKIYKIFQDRRDCIEHSQVKQEIKLNDPNKKRSAKLFFGSELLRVGENNNDNIQNNVNKQSINIKISSIYSQYIQYI